MGKALSFIEKPCLFFLGFGVITAYIPGVIGASIPTGWLFLFFFLPLYIWCYNIEIKLEHIIGFIFLCYVTLSIFWTFRPNIGFLYLLEILSLAMAFCLGSALKDLRYIIIGLTVGLVISDVFAILQYFGYRQYVFTDSGGVAGLFINKNIYCEISVVLLICLLVYRIYYLIPITLPALVLAPSRAGLVAGFICIGYWSIKKNRLNAIIVLLCATLAGVYYLNNNFNYGSILQRIDLWKDTIKGFTLFGNGVGSYEILFPKYATEINTIHERPKHAHNDFMQLFYEFGIGSLILIPFFYNILKIKCKENLILYGILIISLFTFPLHIPSMAFIWFIVAGFVVSNNAPFSYSRIDSRLHLFKWIKTQQPG